MGGGRRSVHIGAISKKNKKCIIFILRVSRYHEGFRRDCARGRGDAGATRDHAAVEAAAHWLTTDRLEVELVGAELAVLAALRWEVGAGIMPHRSGHRQGKVP